MEDSGKVAIARFVFRNKEHLAAIRPGDGVLTLTTMRFADEVVPPSELDDVLPAEKPKVAKREIEMAGQLIDSLTRSFDPDRLPRRVPRAAARADRTQGRRQGRARSAGGRGAGADQGAGPDGRPGAEHRRGARASATTKRPGSWRRTRGEGEKRKPKPKVEKTRGGRKNPARAPKAKSSK